MPGGILLSAGPAQFAEFFPPRTEEDVTAAIGPYDPHPPTFAAGPELDDRLDQLETFLQSLPGAETASGVQ